MANISNIKELAGKLKLSNIAKGNIDLNIKSRTHLDYIETIFLQEIECRRITRIKALRENSNLPKIEFDKKNISTGLIWQLNVIEKLDFIKECKNIIITGNCSKGKTALAAEICNLAINVGNAVVYTKLYDYIESLRDYLSKGRTSHLLRSIKGADILVIDDFLYLNITNTELEMLFKALSSFNESHTIIIIANRKVQDFQDATDNIFLMNSLVDRLKNNAHIINL